MLASPFLGALFWASWTLAAPTPAPHTFTVSSVGGNTTSPYQYGIMFEDINHAIDGGLYAELIQNRAFQAANWSAAQTAPFFPLGGATLNLDNTSSLSAALPYSMNVSPGPDAIDVIGFANPGFNGMEVAPRVYVGSFYVKGDYIGDMTISLVATSNAGIHYASIDIPVTSHSGNWTHVQYTLNPPAPAPNTQNSLAISFTAAKATEGSLNFNLISLFPPTYNSRPNGMRIDLMNVLNELNPSFLRWGGNELEGTGLAESSPRWKWNETIGPMIDRPGRQGTWEYYTTDGVGLAEVFNWAQDLDMNLILGIWDGHYLDGTSIAKADLQPYIDDSLDELEYILGSQSTTYGALRASHGHPDPWPLTYVEIGNEDNLSEGLETYQDYRFEMFRDAISTAYPELVIVASTVNVTLSEGEIGDYHIYTTPDGFATYFDFFDNNPAGSQTFVGEYATVQPNGIATAPHSSNFSLPLSPAPFWIGSVAEAIFLIGGERNADRVFGAAYAPSFENLDMSDAIAWDVDMVGFTANTTNLVRSTSHRVLDLLSGTRFTTTRPVSTIEEVGPLYWVAGANIPTNQLVFKAAVYNSTGPVPVTVQFEGLSSGASANLTILTGTDPYASNGYDQPEVVITNSTMLKSTDAGFSFELPNLSVAVLSTFPNNSPESTFATELTKSGYGGYTGCSLGRPVVSSWGNGC